VPHNRDVQEGGSMECLPFNQFTLPWMHELAQQLAALLAPPNVRERLRFL
jgi:hypothetical protein